MEIKSNKQNKEDKPIMIAMTLKEAEWLKETLKYPLNKRSSQNESWRDCQNRRSIYMGLMIGTSELLMINSEESVVKDRQDNNYRKNIYYPDFKHWTGHDKF